MRGVFAVVLLACAARPAAAQVRLTPAERLVLALAGSVAGTAVLVAGDGRAPVLLLPASPLAAGVVVYGAGRAFGHDGRLVPTLVGAGLGTLPALLLLGIAESAGGGSGVISEDDLLRIAAALAYVVVPPVGAVIGFEGLGAGPVVLSGPRGERAAGLALRVVL